VVTVLFIVSLCFRISLVECHCITLIHVDYSDGSTSAVELIPKLWPFLSHSISSVRRAALRTMSVLLATGKLKVSESVAFTAATLDLNVCM